MDIALHAHSNTDSLTAFEIRLITESYELVSVGRRFAQKFYARLFEQAPEMRVLFPDDLSLQVTKLTDDGTPGSLSRAFAQAERVVPAAVIGFAPGLTGTIQPASGGGDGSGHSRP